MHPSTSFRFLATLFAVVLGQQVAADELPPGLEQAIRNPAIPMIVDATILKFNKEGHAEIKVNAVYKSSLDKKGAKVAPPAKGSPRLVLMGFWRLYLVPRIYQS